MNTRGPSQRCLHRYEVWRRHSGHGSAPGSLVSGRFHFRCVGVIVRGFTPSPHTQLSGLVSAENYTVQQFQMA
ncbi:hypothetical protein E2C01_061631 [Portunus trituberculatus]|uniref:Uncharacterized protein n=1 Tax=Portunus trituberculatus TaxID=210409 RepID=A0A5B7HCX5_PORTR|nr:hypothetical protein [Portunus trituberculatus]